MSTASQSVDTPPLRSRQPSTSRLLTVSLAESGDLVSHGLQRMLAPYGHRLRLLDDADDSGTADVVLIDPYVGAIGRTSMAEWLSRVGPGGRLVVYTWTRSTSPEGLGRLRASGWPLAGWLSKTLPAADLVVALERVDQGGFVVLDEQLSTGADRDEAQVTTSSPPRRLSTRESQVVVLIAQGLSNQEIADASYLSINSVKTYIRSAYRKMGVTRRSQAVLWVIDHDQDAAHRQLTARAPQL